LAKNWPSIPRLQALQVPDFANSSSQQASIDSRPVEAHKLCVADTPVNFKFVMKSVLKAVTHERIAISRAVRVVIDEEPRASWPLSLVMPSQNRSARQKDQMECDARQSRQ
jgi:hypothetical protein